MLLAIKFATRKVKFFRWFDSGDVQSINMLEKIAWLAEQLPEVRFWLPTKEYQMVATYLKLYKVFPTNLCVRLSAYMIDQKPPKFFSLPTSTVDRQGPVHGLHCPAPEQKGVCGDCRACWDNAVANVSYHAH
jgi:hypothetical protein